MDHKIKGDSDCPIVEINLQNNETIKIERGSMAYMSNVTIEGKIVSVKQKGGFVIEDAAGCEYFMPMAQSYLKTQGAIGKTVKAKVIKVNKAQNSIFV